MITQSLVDYSVLGVISWTLPCKTNGLLSHFIVWINGTSTIDSTAYLNSTNVDANLNENSYYYEFNYITSHAAYNYHIDVALVLTNEQEGYRNGIDFSTPDGCKCFH